MLIEVVAASILLNLSKDLNQELEIPLDKNSLSQN